MLHLLAQLQKKLQPVYKTNIIQNRPKPHSPRRVGGGRDGERGGAAGLVWGGGRTGSPTFTGGGDQLGGYLGPKPDQPAAQDSSAITTGSKHQWRGGQQNKMLDYQENPLKGPGVDLGLRQTHTPLGLSSRATAERAQVAYREKVR